MDDIELVLKQAQRACVRQKVAVPVVIVPGVLTRATDSVRSAKRRDASADAFPRSRTTEDLWLSARSLKLVSQSLESMSKVDVEVARFIYSRPIGDTLLLQMRRAQMKK